MQKPIHPNFTPIDINTLFQAKAVHTFSMARRIPTQLKLILKANPDYEVRHALDAQGNEIKVQPKPNIMQMMNAMGLGGNLRGIGFTRRSKKISKKARKQSAKSRKRNRR